MEKVPSRVSATQNQEPSVYLKNDEELVRHSRQPRPAGLEARVPPAVCGPARGDDGPVGKLGVNEGAVVVDVAPKVKVIDLPIRH